MKKQNRRLKIYHPDPDGRRYLVSDCGRMIALEHRTSCGHILRPRNIKAKPNASGYLRLNIDGSKVYQHRIIAKLFIDNPDGKPLIDHIDGNRSNNSASNLRWVTCQENLRAFRNKKENASSRYRGVYFYRKSKKWRANIYANKRTVSLGYFDNEMDAAKAYDTAVTNYGYPTEALNFQPKHNRK